MLTQMKVLTSLDKSSGYPNKLVLNLLFVYEACCYVQQNGSVVPKKVTKKMRKRGRDVCASFILDPYFSFHFFVVFAGRISFSKNPYLTEPTS